MKADFLFDDLNLNRIIHKKKCQKKAHFVDDILKTRGIIYLNFETWLLFAPPIKISGYDPGLQGKNIDPLFANCTGQGSIKSR